MATNPTATTASAPRLRRTLTLWDLILYGVIVIQPVAPMSVFGVLSDRGHGHVVTTILIAMVAMLFTAISYGRMARAYPSAGSAFTYVGQEINPALGYVTGWSMVMDYMLNPMICIVWCSQQAHVFAPSVPYAVWAIFFAGVFTFMNIQGVKTSARVNTLLATGMGVVITIFFVAAARYIFGHPHDGAAFFTRPFYDPQTWDMRAVLGGTSIAVLTYIGFDGISMFAIMGFTLLVANFGSGLGAQIGAARLLYGMGRSNALPKSFFGAIDPKHRVPRNNVIFVGVIALAAALLVSVGLFSYGLGAEMLNFGALIAFMGVNAAAFMRYYVREPEKKLTYLIPPVAGFLICLLLWLNLSRPAKIAGAIWMAVGIAFGAWKTRGFRGDLVNFDLPPEEA
jgi:putrescine importer